MESIKSDAHVVPLVKFRLVNGESIVRELGEDGPVPVPPGTVYYRSFCIVKCTIEGRVAIVLERLEDSPRTFLKGIFLFTQPALQEFEYETVLNKPFAMPPQVLLLRFWYDDGSTELVPYPLQRGDTPPSGNLGTDPTDLMSEEDDRMVEAALCDPYIDGAHAAVDPRDYEDPMLLPTDQVPAQVAATRSKLRKVIGGKD